MRNLLRPLADQREAIPLQAAQTRFWHNFKGLHDVVEPRQGAAIALLADQQNPGLDLTHGVEMREGRLVTLECNDRSGQFHGNAGGIVAQDLKTEPIKHRIVLAQQFGALPGGENACCVKAVLCLPARHRGAGALSKGRINRAVIDTGPRHRHLYISTLVTGETALARAGLRRGLIRRRWCGDRFRRRVQRYNRRAIGNGYCGHGRLREQVRANRPELLLIIAALRDVAVARDHALCPVDL